LGRCSGASVKNGRILRYAYKEEVTPKGVNPYAIRVMADNGVDISGQTSKDLDALADHEFDYLIAPFERSQT